MAACGWSGGTRAAEGDAARSEPRFSFAVLSDPHDKADSWKNALTEVRDGKANKDPAFAPAELLLVAGDVTPPAARHEEFKQVFADVKKRPLFIPALGNHDGGATGQHTRETLIPAIPGVARRGGDSPDYYVDHRSARFIVVNGAVIGDEGRQWTEGAIKSAPASIAHVFVMFHHPAFPRGRRVGQSFDRDPKLRDAFWRTLLAHRDRVRAVFSGHTHSYSRMRVLDPAGKAANDPATRPNEDGGIYQVIAGTTGMARETTLVQVQIDGGKVLFRTLQAKNGTDMPFAEKDKWSNEAGAQELCAEPAGRPAPEAK